MVSHTVDDTGAFPDIATGVLDVSPDAPIDRQNYNRHEYDTEPLLSMWLMYACPYQLNGRVYGCGGRKASVEATGTTFMANERALSHENGRPQVGPPTSAFVAVGKHWLLCGASPLCDITARPFAHLDSTMWTAPFLSSEAANEAHAPLAAVYLQPQSDVWTITVA